MDDVQLAELDALSPFEVQAELGTMARRSGAVVLDAGKGQPNWVATTPRHAYHLLGQFAVGEAERRAEHPDAGWRPNPCGVAARLGAFLDQHLDRPGAGLLAGAVDLGVSKLGFPADAWVGELVDGIMGDTYPHPNRALPRIEAVLHEYLVATHCGEGAPDGRFRIFPTEGGAAAMTYCVQSLRRNGLLVPGDRIAVGTPIFTPYLQIPTLEEYGFELVKVRSDPDRGWQYPQSELDRLRDRSVRMLFLVNPGNPGTRALSADERRALVAIAHDRPDLFMLVDTAYATFVDGFHSLLADIPAQVVAIHSFSKHFGATGSRLGFVAIHQDHVIDQLLREQPADLQVLRTQRYKSATPDLDRFAFADRIVAESRDVALYHIAGLSTPQQVQMALHAAFLLLDRGPAYLRMTREVLLRRLKALLDPLGLPLPGDADTHYYTLLDVLDLARLRHGEDFARWLVARQHPLAFPIALAEDHGVVSLPGRGFEATSWSVRISLANLDDQSYPVIARAVLAVLDDLHTAYQEGPR